MELIQKIIINNVTNRYQVKDKFDYLLESEIKLSKYIGRKYCLGVNSGGSAIFLALESIKTRLNNNKILTNSFTFSAVPSSIIHSNLKPVLIETEDNLVIDLIDLEDKIKSTKSNCLVLSYMRGFIPDMNKVCDICKKYNVILIEDAAHAYGIKFDNKFIGTFGDIVTISTQSNKLINSGEGGFILTDNNDIMLDCMILSGCYENYYLKHRELCPDVSDINKKILSLPNYSLRMSNVQGALILNQIDNLEDLIKKLNDNHDLISNFFKDNELIDIIKQKPNIRPAYDSLQFRLNVDDKDSDEILNNLKKYYKIQRFNDLYNSRYYKSWKFLDDNIINEKIKTERNIKNVFDMRLDHRLNQDDLLEICNNINNLLVKK